MAINLIDSHRIDRYELEVFINKLNFVGYGTQGSEKNSIKNDAEKSKNDEVNSKRKYTIKTVLEHVLETDIRSYSTVENRPKEDQCSIYYEGLKIKETFGDIVKILEERYIVDERPVCGAQNICYDIVLSAIDNTFNSLKPTINRGVVCIFASVPRTLISILQKNPLELTICEDLKNEQVKFGKLSITLSSSMGFTNVIAYHFYEKGYGPHWHIVEKVYEIKNMDGTQTIGDISLRLKLTCHGPETKHANQILLKSVRPRMQPIFVDGNAFDFPFDKHVVQPPPKLMYDNVNRMEVFNPDIKELLHCQRIQEELVESKPCTCPCKGLLENIKNILFENQTQYDLACKTVVQNRCLPTRAVRRNNNCQCVRSTPTTDEDDHRSYCGPRQFSAETLENSKQGNIIDTDAHQEIGMSQTIDSCTNKHINLDKYRVCNNNRQCPGKTPRF